MICVVGVRFRKAGKVYYFDPAGYSIPVGAKVVVETARGVEYGEVAVGPKDVPEEEVVQPLKKVLRIGTERDARTAEENKRKEKEAFAIAEEKIKNHGLEMTLVDVEYTFDNSKIIFYFTADGRVDFRELVRDLASVFRTRIEMRQIGVRDEAKLLGGIGPCGRVLCCTSFLGEFAPVSIRMAKDQNLSLNPSKISGLCGRLMCCLRFEQETYEAAKKDPTLAPGYVPPPIPDDEESVAELEDPPVDMAEDTEQVTGFSARVAKAVYDLDENKPKGAESKHPAAEERRTPSERPASGNSRQSERREASGAAKPQRIKPRPEKPERADRAEKQERGNGGSKGENRSNGARHGAERQHGRSNKQQHGTQHSRKGQAGEQPAQGSHKNAKNHRTRRRAADKAQQANRTQDGSEHEPHA
mgnify:CR=1 FL=1